MFQPLPKLGPRHGPSLAPTVEPFEEDLLCLQIILRQHARVPPHPVVVPIPSQFAPQHDQQVGQFYTSRAFDPFLERQQTGAELFLIGHSFYVGVVFVTPTSCPVKIEAEEGEPSTLLRVPTFESYQRAFLFRELERKFLQPLGEGLQVSAGLVFIFKTDDTIVRISHEMHASFASRSDDAFDPMVLDKVQVDVGQDGRMEWNEIDDPKGRPEGVSAVRRRESNDSPLWRSSGRVFYPPFFHDSGFEPFYNQSDQASIRDSFFEHSHQPIVIHVIKETSDIGFHDPAIVPNVQGFAQIQAGLTRSLSRSVANAFIIEVRFPDTF
jgi:hypothetical protein